MQFQFRGIPLGARPHPVPPHSRRGARLLPHRRPLPRLLLDQLQQQLHPAAVGAEALPPEEEQGGATAEPPRLQVRSTRLQ